MLVGYSTNPIENFIFVCTRKYFDVVSRKLFFFKGRCLTCQVILAITNLQAVVYRVHGILIFGTCTLDGSIMSI